MAHPTGDKDHGSYRLVCLQAYFVTIATILGTGILGLPVTLTHSGLYPFLLSFLLDAVMQSLLIHFFVELLQKACAVQLEGNKEEAVPLNKMAEEEIILDSDDNGEVVMKEVRVASPGQGQIIQPPNLHLLGQLFLSCGMRQMFDILIILQFIALLICYALAGSEAYAQLIGIDHFYVIPVFVWVLTLAIVFALQLIQPIISVLTFIKGSVLLATTLVTFYVGVTVGRTISNDFAYVGAPFLMGTVALGGTINTMPFTFEKIVYKKEVIKTYRLAVQLGLWTCVFLNIMWCWSVLDIVPQTVVQACAGMTPPSSPFLLSAANASTSTSTSTSTLPSSSAVCHGELSLESAKFKGEISTLPMTKILGRDYPRYTWVAVLVEVFIMVSITVSYLTIGGALYHTLTGVVHSILMKRGGYHDQSKTPPRVCCTRLKVFSVVVSLVAFLLVFAVAMADPQGFVEILEKFASLTLNAQAGVFVFLMVLSSRRRSSAHIPVPVATWLRPLVWTLPVFFNAAVVMDVYNTVRDIVRPPSLEPVVWNSSVVVGGNSSLAGDSPSVVTTLLPNTTLS
ncbi:uncharacterized protein LOC143275376 [Babylonia areolata]|uniref:uncharacterized protein LOC143275376 n=1 Tax=Babylonia areolata TaxID=304850 RepID=UPI003FD5349F